MGGRGGIERLSIPGLCKRLLLLSPPKTSISWRNRAAKLAREWSWLPTFSFGILNLDSDVYENDLFCLDWTILQLLTALCLWKKNFEHQNNLDSGSVRETFAGKSWSAKVQTLSLTAHSFNFFEAC